MSRMNCARWWLRIRRSATTGMSSPEAVVFIPGVVRGLNLACRAVAQPGDGVLVQLPVYPPIHCVPAVHGLRRVDNQLAPDSTGRYSVDYDQFESAIGERTPLFSLCSPHNPVGARVHEGRTCSHGRDMPAS